jgi:hypothetical protein
MIQMHATLTKDFSAPVTNVIASLDEHTNKAFYLAFSEGANAWGLRIVPVSPQKNQPDASLMPSALLQFAFARKVSKPQPKDIAATPAKDSVLLE